MTLPRLGPASIGSIPTASLCKSKFSQKVFCAEGLSPVDAWPCASVGTGNLAQMPVCNDALTLCEVQSATGKPSPRPLIQSPRDQHSLTSLSSMRVRLRAPSTAVVAAKDAPARQVELAGAVLPALHENRATSTRHRVRAVLKQHSSVLSKL
jgi:hypothetical protein